MIIKILNSIRTAGITSNDTHELRLQKSLLYFVSGLISVASGIWLVVYWLLGPRLSASIPLALQVAVAGNIAVHATCGNFKIFRNFLLAIILFFPFIAQWALGDFVSASGIVLWGILSPICAIFCLGSRASAPWFAAYFFMIILTGGADYFLADWLPRSEPVPRSISVIFFAINIATVSLLVYLSVYFALKERLSTLNKLECTHHKLTQEQAKSEHLILNILPSAVAQRLKSPGAQIADRYNNVSVMFADIVNFTELASEMTAVDVFSLLDTIFEKFDALAEQGNLEKIKTIGDEYMVASGLDDLRPSSTASLATLALAMNDWITNECSLMLGHPVRLRIGIATGPVIAGIIGKKKFTYDLWGDTVNLAHRITSEATPGEVLCDATTHAALHPHFNLEGPTAVALKGKGNILTWRLRDRRQSIR